MIKNHKGFTLIELMVVIAIIVILSGIILTFLISARNKSRDSAVQQELSHLRTQANLYLADNGSYGPDLPINTSCQPASGLFSDPKVRPLLEHIDVLGSANTCWSFGQTFLVMVTLRAIPDKAWCVDSQNHSQMVLAGTIPGGYNYDCSSMPVGIGVMVAP